MFTPDPDGIWPTQYHDLRTRAEINPSPLQEEVLKLVFANCPAAAPPWLGIWDKERELARRPRRAA